MDIKLFNCIKLSDISTYRQLLMGIGIFGVLFSHWFGFQSINQGIPYTISDLIVKLVFTEGFLFLSGFGLYYSFSSNSNIGAFYKKRIIRLYLPFLLLSIPLYTFFLIVRNDYDIYDYVKQLTTIYFWTNGNYGGMWYVSLSMLLYLLFPFLYRFIFRRVLHCCILLRTIVVIAVLYLLLFLINYTNPGYFEMISIGTGKIVFFILGCLFGYEVKNKAMTNNAYIYLIIVVFLMYVVLTATRFFFHRGGAILTGLCGIFQKFTFIPLICVLFNLFNNSKLFLGISMVLNWFGKYSLELFILHLHLFMFFKYSFINEMLPLLYQSTLAIVLSLLLCAPTHRLMANITKVYFSK